MILILAGVTIATLTGDNGLLQKATDAKQENEEATALEKIQVEVAGSYGFDGKIDVEHINTNLKRISGLKYEDSPLSEQNKIIKFPAIVELDNNSYEIKNDGTVTPIKPQAIGNLTKDNYGDYLDLGQSIVGTSSTADDWRILYNDKNNAYGGSSGARVYAILADYLPNTNQAVLDAGFKTSEVNDVSGTYNVFSSTSRQNLLDRLNHVTAWQSLIPENLRNSAQVKGATTANILLASYNEKYNNNPAKTLSTSTHFYDSSNKVDTLYMPHPDSKAYNGCSGYWLSTPNASDQIRLWVSYRDGSLYVSTDYTVYYCKYGLCPIVSLSSDMKVISNTEDGKTIWSVVQ